MTKLAPLPFFVVLSLLADNVLPIHGEKITIAPSRLPFSALMNTKNAGASTTRLYEALAGTGMISITGIPDPFTQDQIKTLAFLHNCASEGGDAVSERIREHVFEDGTRRRTLATHSTKAEGPQPLFEKQTKKTPLVCQALEEASQRFRQVVATVTQAFAQALDQIVDPQDQILYTADGSVSYSTVAQIVEEGEHLEHFHSYQVDPEESLFKNTGTDEDAKTIEWHTDQGLFLVFTPARWSGGDGSMTGMMVEGDTGFHVQLSDGRKAMVQFEDGVDQLVILLGDGIHQVLQDKSNGLVATPHSLSMPVPPSPEIARVWYGRMVLAPRDAMHPAHEDMTFGEIRDHMIDTSRKNLEEGLTREVMSLGCSSPNSYARQLEDSSCEGDTLQCWHRCMNNTQYNVSTEICQAQGLDLACISPTRKLWTGLHGDYFPGCIDMETAENWTAPPQYSPRNDAVCTIDLYNSFLQNTTGSYDHETTLKENVTTMQWSIDSDKKHVIGKLIFNGMFGWLAFGFVNVGGGLNGMNGAHIIMALPGSNYSVWNGLDLSLPANVNAYRIALDASAFRFWDTPIQTYDEIVSQDSQVLEIESTDCFTAIKFSLTGIAGRSFNLTGSDELLWAANGLSSWVEYHNARGHFTANWAHEHAPEGDHDHDAEESKNSTTPTGTSATGTGTSAAGRVNVPHAMIIAGITMMVVAVSTWVI